MTRYRIEIEYDGRNYVGWQRQKTGNSIQAALEEAVFRFCGEEVRVFGAGRTDAGVHALGQVAHFDISRATSAETVRDAVNAHLRSQPITVIDACEVDDTFDARHSARMRSYLYRILNRRSPPALDRGRVWHVGTPIDAEAMHLAAQSLVGHHDFTTLRASICQAKSPVKTLDRLNVERQGDEILIHAEARSFLHHQVRKMVGTLKMVGSGKWLPVRVGDALAARDPAAAGPTAPAEGLYLVSVSYN